nr:uncharacterized protein LOC111507466 [Leptinotarsa decemlineata]
MAEEGPQIKPVQGVTYHTIIALCLGGLLFGVLMIALSWYCYHRRLRNAKRHGPDQPLAFHTHRRPTAVKSPAGSGGGTHYLKKSPSPTGPVKTPPGMSTPHTPSPTGSVIGPLESGVMNSGQLESKSGMEPVVKDVFNSENEKNHQPTKEEIETNEKNLQQNAAYLGQLVFKLRKQCQDNTRKKFGYLYKADISQPTAVIEWCLVIFVLINLSECFNQLTNITLHFVILSFDRYSRDDIIGEVFCALNGVDITQIESQQMAVCREIQPRSLKIRSQGRGDILVSLCWQPAANRLTVVVLKARNLPKMDVTGLADPYVKIYLLYNGQRIAKKKTHVKKRTLSPVFNESFVFDIPQGGEGLDAVSLEFLLLDWDRVTKNEVIGRLDLGGTKCTGSALHHWNEVCNSPRRQIAEWHKLRE